MTSAGYTATAPAAESYAYDANGNRTNTGYSTGASNELLSDGTYNYTYDAVGNRITKTGIAGGAADGQSTTYSWDYRNRLTEVDSYSSGTLTQAVAYVYDAFDRMIERKVDATGAVDASGNPTFSLVQSFVYDGNDVVLEFDNGSLTNRYLSAPGPSGVDVVMAQEAVSSPSAAGTVTWPLTDNLNSVRDVVDSTGAVIDHLVYNSFGQIASETHPNVAHLQGYTGAFTDPLTGLVNDWHRWYAPATGKWLSQDPIGFPAGDANLSRYVSNDPLNAIDATGLWSFFRWLYAGDGNASDEKYDAALDAAGQAYTENAGNTHQCLRIVGSVDPTPLSGYVESKLTQLEEEELHALVMQNSNPLLRQAADGAEAIAHIKDAYNFAKAARNLTRSGQSCSRNLGAKPGPKTDINAPHNAKIRSEAEKLRAEGNEIVSGGGGKERLIPTPGGKKTGRRPDIEYRTPQGEMKGRNVGKTKADGSPLTREQEALEDLNGPGDLPTDFVPYDR